MTSTRKRLHSGRPKAPCRPDDESASGNLESFAVAHLRVAYHEAGHVVMARRLKYARKPRRSTIHFFDEASLRAAELSGNFGRTETRPFRPEGPTPYTLRVLAAETVVCVAGVEAEKLWTGIYNWIGALHDLREAQDVAEDVLRDDDAVKEHLNKAHRTARELLQTRWDEVTKVATALDARHTLTAEEIRRILP